MTILPEIPASLRTLMAEIGPSWAEDTRGHIALMLEKFSEVLVWAPKEDVNVQRDISYGPNERQNFDLFMPKVRAPSRPALIFVHGGAFTHGNRNRTPEIYSNVMYYFARHGILGINMGYRLAGDAVYPGAAMDVASVVAWTRANAETLGIDPARIFLMGHSAGGAHVGSYAFDNRIHPAEGPGLAGLLIVSGRVRADNRAGNPNAQRVETYYGSDSSIYENVSPVSHVTHDSVRTFIAFAEYENPFIDVYCLELAYRLAAAKGIAPQVLQMKGHNHTSIIAHFNTAEDKLGQACMNFIFS
jgi:acetyl esterase